MAVHLLRDAHLFICSTFRYELPPRKRNKRAYQIPRNCAFYGAGFSIWYLKAVVGLVAENGRPASFFVSARERRRSEVLERQHIINY